MANVEVQNARNRPDAPGIPLGDLELAPLFSLEQTEARVMHHARDKAPNFSRFDYPEHTLGEYAPYVKDNFYHLAYSYAYVTPITPRLRHTFDHRDIVATVQWEAWIELKATNLTTVFQELAAYRGKLVIRMWARLTSARKRKKCYNSYTVDEDPFSDVHEHAYPSGSEDTGSGKGSGSASGSGSGSGVGGPQGQGGSEHIESREPPLMLDGESGLGP